MDPLTHTLVGAALAETRLGRDRAGERVPLAAAALVVGANLPDVDVLAYLEGADCALLYRRGWTHGVLAVAVLPLVLTLILLAWDRLVGRHRDRDPAPAGRLLTLSYLAVATHPALDWLNTYGVRWLMPFDGRWFYGDAVFIVDPWIWLVLGVGVFLARAPHTRRGLAGWGMLAVLTTAALLAGWAWPPSVAKLPALVLWAAGLTLGIVGQRSPRFTSGMRSTRWASLAIALTTLYIVAMVASSDAARERVRTELATEGTELVPARRGRDAHALMVGPVPVNPFRREVVAATPGAYLVGSFDWLAAAGEPRLTLGAPLERPVPHPAVGAALAEPGVEGMLEWMRFPFYRVEQEPEGFTVYILDARYTRRPTRGFGGTVVPLGEEAAGGVLSIFREDGTGGS